MEDAPLTDVIQAAYDNAIDAIYSGNLSINNTQDVFHLAHTYALFDLYKGNKKPNKKHHYDKPIEKLYKLFDSGTINENNTYAAFAYCYLKVFVREKAIKKKSFQAQFNYENKKYA